MDGTTTRTTPTGPEPVDQHVLVVGASAAGLATAEALRRDGHRGRLTLLDAETHQPYDRPPLSKQLLSGAWTPDRVVLRDAATIAALDAEVLLGERAVRLDVAAREVETAGGRRIAADAVVLATGSRPRRLPGQDGVRGAHVIHSLDDAVALRDELRDALRESRRVVVVGDGALGCEVAATASGLGLDVTLLGTSATPMARQLGPLVSARLADLHRRHGVQLCRGARAARVESASGAATGVLLVDGTEVTADVVVVAIGAKPAVAWLAGSGLELDDGIVTDSRCRTADGIWAVGDVARFAHAGTGALVRLENRTNATEQAMAVARDVLGDGAPYAPVPGFWTDQFGVRIQVHGTVPAADDPHAAHEVVEGDPVDGRFVALARRHGDLVAVIGWAMPKQTAQHRRALVAAAAAAALPGA